MEVQRTPIDRGQARRFSVVWLDDYAAPGVKTLALSDVLRVADRLGSGFDDESGKAVTRVWEVVALSDALGRSSLLLAVEGGASVLGLS